MNRIIIYVVGSLVSLIAMALYRTSPAWTGMAGVVAGAFLGPLINIMAENGRFLRLFFYSLRNWRRYVRVSISYLYRIRVESEYLLIKGGRFDQYQPVGGVYKYYPSASGVFAKLEVLQDDLLVPDTVSANDLRVRVPGRHLIAFFRWFESGEGRETDAWREFFEELVLGGHLSRETFGYISYQRRKRHYHPIRYSEHAQSWELLVADVVELLPTDAQLAELKDLKGAGDSGVLWATEAQIRRRGAQIGNSKHPIQIAENAVWTI